MSRRLVHVDVEEVKAAARQSAADLGYSLLKPLQEEVVVQFATGHDVFAVLPTGFGKSLCYACACVTLVLVLRACVTSTFDKLRQATPGSSFALVVTPLIAIMQDQVDSWCEKGLKAAYVSGETQGKADIVRGVTNGHFQLILFTPEILLSRKWRKMLLTEPFQENLIGLIVDEAHCVNSWGNTFRTALAHIGEIRSLIPANVSVMALTATATKYVRQTVARQLGMRVPAVITAPPCRPNVTFSVQGFSCIEDLMYLVEQLRSEGKEMGRVIIYCQHIQDCADLYAFFQRSLGHHFLSPPDAPNQSRFRVVDMFTSITDLNVKTQIVKSFTTSDAPLRIVISTLAFGMGIDCPDVRSVVHLGPPDDTDLYIQQTGRAGRDGAPARANLLWNKLNARFVQQHMKDYCHNREICRRDFLFSDYDGYISSDYSKTCCCCDLCAITCTCTYCQE